MYVQQLLQLSSLFSQGPQDVWFITMTSVFCTPAGLKACSIIDNYCVVMTTASVMRLSTVMVEWGNEITHC